MDPDAQAETVARYQIPPTTWAAVAAAAEWEEEVEIIWEVAAAVPQI